MTTNTQRVDVARLSVSVERFEPVIGRELLDPATETYRQVAVMDPFIGGAYVRHSDYAALLQQLADTANKSDSRRVKLIKAQRQRRELHEYIRMMAAEISMLRNGAEQEKLNILTRLHAAERARERAIGLLRAVIAWRHTAPIAETPNRKEGGVFGRIAAFLAANK